MVCNGSEALFTKSIRWPVPRDLAAEIFGLVTGVSSSEGLGAELLPLWDEMEKICGSQRGGPTAGTDLMMFPRFLERVHPLWTVIIGPFGRATVTDSIISKRPLSMCVLGSFDLWRCCKEKSPNIRHGFAGIVKTLVAFLSLSHACAWWRPVTIPLSEMGKTIRS